MKKKSLTPEELAKRWWWNREEIRRDGVREVDWPVVEEAARNYELLRRSPMGKQFVKTYLQLVPDERSVIHGLWATWSKSAYRFAIRREQYNEKGWTPVYETEHRQWNLRRADKNLIDEFIREIRILREIQKIPAPHPNKGEKHRGVSWNLIEILDRKQNGIGKLDDSERHTASVAQRRAEKYFIEYKYALDQWHNNPNPAFNIGETDDSDTAD
jgi:hypothetical protein